MKVTKNIVLIWITDSTYHTKNKKRITITSKILKKEIKNQISLDIKYSKKYGIIFHYLNYVLLLDWISEQLEKINTMITKMPFIYLISFGLLLIHPLS